MQPGLAADRLDLQSIVNSKCQYEFRLLLEGDGGSNHQPNKLDLHSAPLVGADPVGGCIFYFSDY